MNSERIQQGFTLLEILVAVAIFSTLAYLSYGGMQEIIKSREIIDEKSRRFDDIQFAFTVINNDLKQVVNRPIRGRLGDKHNAFERQPDSTIFLSFTTQVVSPWQINIQKSSLQRIDYRWQDKILYRDVWPVLDRAHNTEPIAQELLGEVSQFNIEFLYDKSYEFWPLAAAEGKVPVIPYALKIILSLNESLTINKVFILGQS